MGVREARLPKGVRRVLFNLFMLIFLLRQTTKSLGNLGTPSSKPYWGGKGKHEFIKLAIWTDSGLSYVAAPNEEGDVWLR